MSFITEEFLLETDFAQQLYYGFAADKPIIDYHCHLPPADIQEDRIFGNLTRIWLDGDHYKWRAMRMLGVEEKYITGDASDYEKFQKWAESVPHTLRNPLYHWTHLELARYFDQQVQLDASNAKEVYEGSEEYLSDSSYSARNLLRKMNVEVVCTTDDPSDDLSAHQSLAGDFEIKVLPTFRPDNILLIQKDQFPNYIQKLAASTDKDVSCLSDLLEVLESRLKYFHSIGCRLSDHGLEQINSVKYDEETVKQTFVDALSGKKVSHSSAKEYQSYLLEFLSGHYHKLGWVQQFHLGALRNTNTRLLQELGPDTGFDSIGDFKHAASLGRHLDQMEIGNQLAKTILYNLNPSDNEVFATMTGNYFQEGVRGKVQFGSGWWFNDQKDGMERQLNVLSNMGLLSCFVGMLTDSRSFMSFPRHEYFRRILCNLLGNDVKKGLLPNDLHLLGELVANISYFNAKNYFNFES